MYSSFVSFSSLPLPRRQALAFSSSRTDALGLPQPSLRRPLRIALIAALIGAVLGAWLIPAPAHRFIERGQRSAPASLSIVDDGALSPNERHIIENTRWYAPAQIVVVVGGTELVAAGRSPRVDDRLVREQVLVQRAPEVLRDPTAAAPMLNSQAVVLVLVPEAGFAGAVVPHRYDDVLGPFDRLDLLGGLRQDYAEATANNPDEATAAAMASLARYVHAPKAAAYQWGWIGAAMGAVAGFAAGRIRPTTSTRRQLLRRLDELPRPSLYGLLDNPYHRAANARLERLQAAHAQLRKAAPGLARGELERQVRLIERSHLLLVNLPGLRRTGAPLLDITSAAALGADRKALSRAAEALRKGDLAAEEILDREAARMAAAGAGELAALRRLDDPGVC